MRTCVASVIPPWLLLETSLDLQLACSMFRVPPHQLTSREHKTCAPSLQAQYIYPSTRALCSRTTDPPIGLEQPSSLLSPHQVLSPPSASRCVPVRLPREPGFRPQHGLQDAARFHGDRKGARPNSPTLSAAGPTFSGDKHQPNLNDGVITTPTRTHARTSRARSRQCC